MGGSYYATKLSGRRLERCYEIAPPRVKRYLEAEIRHVLDRLRPSDTVLELGCGCGRVARRLAERARRVVGIDISEESLVLAPARDPGSSRLDFLRMDALALSFPGDTFDAVCCVQNGICAFGVDATALVLEAARVLRPGGRGFFSTYSDRFWQDRLEWFEAQAAERLIGPLDRDACVDGTIVCRDGFRAGRMTPAALCALAASIGIDAEIVEVDASSVFFEFTKAADPRMGRTPGDTS